jgi:hypothetical protein
MHLLRGWAVSGEYAREALKILRQNGSMQELDALVALLKRVETEFGVDGHGSPFEDGECHLIDDIRRLLGAR